jgi:hypothetical protein
VEILGRLIRKLHDTCTCLSDKRKGKNVRYAMADFGMAAFSVFFMQSPSFLAHQRRLAEGRGCGRSNCGTLFEMSLIPSDNHVRAMLDPSRRWIAFCRSSTPLLMPWRKAAAFRTSGCLVNAY